MKELDSSKIKILVCCHKPCELPQDDIFLPIQVGAAISNVDLGIQRDDQLNGQSCDNISAKNQSYCELTAVYWAWKNIKMLYPDLEYIGLNHYRRFFSFDKSRLLDDIILQPLDSIVNYRINRDKLGKYLGQGYVITAKKRQYPYALDIDYMYCHISDDFKILQHVVHSMHPEYDDAFYDVMKRNNAMAHYNMIILRWEEFDEYCKWLFGILTECESRIDLSCYNPVQKRIYGYMAERLLNVYTYKNCRKIKKLNIYKFDNEKPKNLFMTALKVVRRTVLGKLFCIKRGERHAELMDNEKHMKLIGQN